MDYLILLPVVLPVLLGAAIVLLPEKVFGTRRGLIIVTQVSFLVSAALAVFVISGAAGERLVLFPLVDGVDVCFVVDDIGRFFAAVSVVLFLAAGIYAFFYMERGQEEKWFYGFCLTVFGMLTGLVFSGNFVTLYAFYVFTVLAALPLVLHTGTREAVMAGLKYAVYLLSGAFLALIGICMLYRYGGAADFAVGGSLDPEFFSESGAAYASVAAFLIIIGFGVGAGLFPFHAWLPSVAVSAPAPAAVFVVGAVAQGALLAVLRAVYCCVGARLLDGTWVQKGWIALAILSMVMGVLLVFKEKRLKRRLAYAAVAGFACVMLGLAMSGETAGALSWL